MKLENDEFVLEFLFQENCFGLNLNQVNFKATMETLQLEIMEIQQIEIDEEVSHQIYLFIILQRILL